MFNYKGKLRQPVVIFIVTSKSIAEMFSCFPVTCLTSPVFILFQFDAYMSRNDSVVEINFCI